VTDVLYIKVREDHRAVSKSCHIAIGINEYRYREIIGFLIQDGESELTRSNFFEHLKNRDLKGTKLVVSDSHKGLVSAIRESFTGVSWQRCQVHFMRNVLTMFLKKILKPSEKLLRLSFTIQISSELVMPKTNLLINSVIINDTKKLVKF